MQNYGDPNTNHSFGPSYSYDGYYSVTTPQGTMLYPHLQRSSYPIVDMTFPPNPTLLLQQNDFFQQQLAAKDHELRLALQEIQRLKETLNSTQSQQTQYIQAYERLNFKNAALAQENVALKQQMTATQPVAYNEDTHHLSILSSSVLTTVERPGVFENRVLSLPTISSPDLKTPLDLPPLRFHLEETENSSAYFQQFIPFIQEEIRAGLAGQIEKISTQHLRSFTACFHPEQIKGAGEYALNLVCHTNELPTLNHSFQYEAVLIVVKPNAFSSIRNGMLKNRCRVF